MTRPDLQTGPLPATDPHVADGLWDLHNLANAKRLCDFQFAQVGGEPGANVLEVGAGIGTFSARLLDAGAQTLVLVEPEDACVRELERRFAADGRVEVHAELLPDAPSLQGRGGFFDFALTQNVLEHIEDDHAAMAAMARTLRPGGG